jgi:hypothetical protein
MANPITITIPHKLSRGEARARVQESVDAHVNRALRNVLRAKEVRPPVLVFDRCDARTSFLAYRHDRWALGRKQALYTTPDPRPTAFRSPSELVEHGECEVTAHPVAVWHGGFLDGGLHIDRFSRWLENPQLASITRH